MNQRVWIIEGWQGQTSFWSKEIPYSTLSESQVKDVLRCLVTKHGLSEEEIVSAFARANSGFYAPHLEIQTSGAKEPWCMSCGDNPYFTARVSTYSLQRELTLLGRGMIAQKATRLAHVVSRASGTPTSPPDRMAGYVYILFDGMTGLCKIGHTKTEGYRQRVQMGSHGSVLVNVVNAKMADCVAAEAKCHEHFAQYRTNGEWFSAKLLDIIQYVHVELDWLEIDYENKARLVQYIIHCQSGDRAGAKEALMGGRRKYSRLKPTTS